MNLFFKLGIAAVCLSVSALSYAAPISYVGDLTNGQTQTGALTRNGSVSGQWWSFSASAGDLVSITVNRLTRQLDPAFYLYEGVASDSSQLMSHRLAFADDEINVPGPFGDPRLDNFGIDTAGQYSLYIFSYASNWICDDYQYQVTLENTPAQVDVSEPAILSLFSLALFGVAGLRKRLPR